MIRLPSLLAAVFAAAGLAMLSAAAAEEEATALEARALVAEAIEVYDFQGAEAFFTNVAQKPRPDWFYGDLYLFVIRQSDGVNVVHAADPSIVGTDVRTLEDATGAPLGPILVDAATENGHWARYVWEDPATGEPAPKESWLVLHDGYVFGAGIYE